MFSGLLFRCIEEPSLNRQACRDMEYLWENPTYHFDNIHSSLGTLFIGECLACPPLHL